ASASVELGGGLLVIDQATDVAAGIEALGATRSGSISSLRSVTLTGTLGSGSVPARGRASALTLAGAAAGATVGSTIVATTRSFGLGKSVLLGWDSEQLPSSALADLYLRIADR